MARNKRLPIRCVAINCVKAEEAGGIFTVRGCSGRLCLLFCNVAMLGNKRGVVATQFNFFEGEMNSILKGGLLFFAGVVLTLLVVFDATPWRHTHLNQLGVFAPDRGAWAGR